MPTGPGGLDSNGIWQFGEDDSEALASDLLNLGMGSVSTALTNLEPAGVLQVVSVAKTDTFTMSSSTYADVTGLSVSITPSSSSNKILVLSNVSMGQTVVGGGVNMQLLRDATAIFIGDAAGGRPRTSFGSRFDPTGSNQEQTSASPVFLDAPNTTSPVTYKIQVRIGSGGVVTVNRSGLDSDSVQFPRSSSSITVMEVAG